MGIYHTIKSWHKTWRLFLAPTTGKGHPATTKTSIKTSIIIAALLTGKKRGAFGSSSAKLLKVTDGSASPWKGARGNIDWEIPSLLLWFIIIQTKEGTPGGQRRWSSRNVVVCGDLITSMIHISQTFVLLCIWRSLANITPPTSEWETLFATHARTHTHTQTLLVWVCQSSPSPKIDGSY